MQRMEVYLPAGDITVQVDPLLSDVHIGDVVVVLPVCARAAPLASSTAVSKIAVRIMLVSDFLEFGTLPGKLKFVLHCPLPDSPAPFPQHSDRIRLLRTLPRVPQEDISSQRTAWKAPSPGSIFPA